MTPEVIVMLSALLVGLLGNVGFVAFGYGRITGGVKALGDRLAALENEVRSNPLVTTLEKAVEANATALDKALAAHGQSLFSMGQLTTKVETLQMDVTRMKDLLAELLAKGRTR